VAPLRRLSTCTGTSRGTSAAPAGGGTLTIWADDLRSAAMKKFAAQFGQENGVTVNVQTVSKDLQNFVTAAVAGKGRLARAT